MRQGLIRNLRGFYEKVKGKRIAFRDMDMDGRPDYVFLVKGQYLRTHFGEREHTYRLVYRVSLDQGLGEPVHVQTFRGKPESLVVDDVDRDGVPEVVYLEKGEFLFVRLGRVIFLYRLMLMDGRGDGTFEEPRQLATFRGLPEEF